MKMVRKWKRIVAGLFVAVMCMAYLPVSMSVTAADADNQNNYKNAVAASNVLTEGHDIILVPDNSESMWTQQSQRDQALRSICSLAAGSDTRIGVVYFAKEIYSTLNLTSVADETGLQTVTEFLNMRERDRSNWDTNIGAALEAARGMFENQDTSRHRSIILFSDGINTTSNADAKTRQQVKLLQEEGVDIYCVYLQKKANEEDYLKSIVNYFDSENTYDQERFKKVTNSEVDTLTEEFAKVFYAAKNNMKYGEISFDSAGKCNFYIPDLGVSRIQFYLKGDSNFGVRLEGPEDQEINYLADENSWYVSVEEPVVGEWELSVLADNPEQIKGTAAYYADILAYAEVVDAKEETEGIFKNQSVKIKACFFDTDGNEIQSDDTKDVTAKVVLKASSGEELEKELTLSNTGSGYESEAFAFDTYGEYALQLRIQYEDFIDLTYEFAGEEIGGHAPVINNQSGIFFAEKDKDGYQFTYNTEELFQDPEEEAVTFDVVQMNAGNQVNVTEENGVIVIHTQTCGDVKFALDLTDEAGLTSRLMMEGKVLNKKMVDMTLMAVAAVFAGLIVIMISKKNRKRNLGKQIAAEDAALVEKGENAIKICRKIDARPSEEVEQAWETLVENIKETCEELQKEQIEQFELQEYLQKDFLDKKFKKLNQCKQIIKEKRAYLSDCLGISPDKKPSKELLKKYQNYNAEAAKAVQVLSDEAEVYQKELALLEEESDMVSEKYVEVTEAMETPIKCDLFLNWREYIGDKSCKHKGEYLKGCYSLDSVSLLTRRGTKTVKDILKNESSGIYVYGYENEDEEPGLELRSNEAFTIRNDASGADARKTKKAVIMRGEVYRVISAVGEMKIEVL